MRIAEEFGAKVFHFNWINDFSAARNFALSKCRGKWILYLDADEQLSSSSVDELNKIIKRDEKLGFKCIVDSINTHGGKSNQMTYTRLFYNSPDIKFFGKVHEQIDDSLLKAKYNIIDSHILITHYGYDLDDDDLKQKAARNLDMLISEYNESKASYYAYQLANTYSILEDNSNANKFYNEALKDKALFKEYKGIAYLNLADAEFKNHNINGALNFLEKGISADAENPMLFMLASQIYLRQGKLDDALRNCLQALNVNSLNHKNSVLKLRMNEETIIFQCLLIALKKNDTVEFNQLVEKLKSNNSISQLITHLTEGEAFDINKFRSSINDNNISLILALLEKCMDNNFVLEFLLSIKYRFSENAKYLSSLGRAYMDNNLFYEAALVLENSLLMKHKDPTAIFYLISVYLMINKMDRVIDIIMLGETEFGSIPEFNTQLQKLKEKIKPILSTKEKENY